MRREMTVYMRDPDDHTRGRLQELITSCGASVYAISVEPDSYRYTPHRITVEGDDASLEAVSELFLDMESAPDLHIGQVSLWDGA